MADARTTQARAGTRKPSWLKARPPVAGPFRATGAVLRELRLHTVCDEARCPNKGECFSAGTATFLVLGDVCTRRCGFCAVKHAGPGTVDQDEPRRVAEAAARLGLAHVVVTSVTRDDLADGGAALFAATIRALHERLPAATVEVLVPDFGGGDAALDAVLAARPDVLSHNLETVPRLSPRVRPQGDYRRSLRLLEAAAAARPRPLVKTGLMVGLGETPDELAAVFGDCAAAGVDVVTVGQYLQPRADCLPVARFATPAEFATLETEGARRGIRVVAGPFVRSSYHAAEILAADGAAGREDG